MDLSRAEERRAFRAYWQGLIDPRTRTDTTKHSPKAEWFVKWIKLGMFHEDLDIWEEMYGEK